MSGCKRSQDSRANSSEEDVTRRSKASTPTAIIPNVCRQCSTEYFNLAPGESSVDPLSVEGVRAATVRVCEGVRCDGCKECEGVECFKAGLFVHPSQSHDQLTS